MSVMMKIDPQSAALTLAKEMVLVPSLEDLKKFCLEHQEIFADMFEEHLITLVRGQSQFSPGAKEMLAFVRHVRQFGLESGLQALEEML